MTTDRLIPTSNAPPARGVRWLARTLLLTALAVPAPAFADIVWTPEDGWFIPSRRVKPTAGALLENSERAFDAKRYEDAAEGYRMFVEFYGASDEGNFAHRRLLESQFSARQYPEALETIATILARKPDGETVNFVLQKKYEIGIAYLSGHPRRFFGISLPGESYGVEVLDELVKSFPYQSYSDDALYHIASYYHREEKYEQAELIYKRVIDKYPQSEWTGIAEYQIGISAMSRLKGVHYDLTPLEEAERRFNRYLRVYPRGDRARDAQAKLDEISRLRAEKLLGIARFYQREGKTKAVRYYLLRVLSDHEGTPSAEEARRLMKRFGWTSDE